MNIHQIKLQLIQSVLDCNDIEILNKIEHILKDTMDDNNQVMEPNEVYETKEIDIVPELHYRKLDEDHRKHLAGETESYTWEEVEQRLSKKYDL